MTESLLHQHRRVRRLRNTIVVLSLSAIAITLLWSYVRTFYCWETDYCNIIENATSFTCLSCQADLAIRVFLGMALVALITMLLMLFSYDLDYPIARDEKMVERAVGQVMGQRIHRTALSLGSDGPGTWTAAAAVVALVIVVFVVFGPFNAMWLF